MKTPKPTANGVTAFFLFDNTTRLLQQAAKVITINSTVGLEARLYDKELTIALSIHGQHRASGT